MVSYDTSLGDGSAIKSLVLTDSMTNLPSYISGDANSNLKLEPNETWLYQVSLHHPSYYKHADD